MFRRIVVLCLLLTVFLLTVAEAQQPKKLPLVGYLSSDTQLASPRVPRAIRQALREFGYIEGQNIAIECRYGDGAVLTT